MATVTPDDLDAALSRFLAEEEATELDRFDYADAWRLGTWLIERGRRDGLEMATTVVIGEQHVFTAALPGTSRDNDLWLDRKIGVVRMFGHSSFYVQHLFRKQGREFLTESRLDPTQYAAAGGGFPIQVRGIVVGAIANSRWAESGEHDLAVEALRALKA